MAITINGTGSITGLTAGGLPDASITSDDIAAGAVTAAKIGYAGAILQVKQIYKQDTFTTTSTSFTDVTGLSLAITPSSASNYILVCSYFVLANTNTGGNYYSQARLIRDSTEIFAGTAASNRPGAVTYTNKGDITIAQATGFIYRDSPATTSEVTYKIQLKTESSSTASIGRTPADADTTNHARMPANIVLMEVAG
jgi:hypothetical protein